MYILIHAVVRNTGMMLTLRRHPCHVRCSRSPASAPSLANCCCIIKLHLALFIRDSARCEKESPTMLYMSSSSSNAFKSTGSSKVLGICVTPSSISRATGASADILLLTLLSVLEQIKRNLWLTYIYTQQRSSFSTLMMSSRIASLNTEAAAYSGYAMEE